MAKHYYFKYFMQNAAFSKWLKLRSDIETNEIYFSIYFGSWSSSEYKNVKNGDSKLAPDLLKKINKDQVVSFFDIPQIVEDVYFWIFHNEFIYCFKIIKNPIEDAKREVSPYAFVENTEIERPKSLKATLYKKFNKIDLPEFFANINSNQYYNRTTIKPLKEKELKLAEYLVQNKKLQIKDEDYLEYLSPMQFETLIFLIFNNPPFSYCSSFRGGTLKDYDLKVYPQKVNPNEYPSYFKGIDFSKPFWIQVKYMDKNPLDEKHLKSKNMYLAYIGGDNEDAVHKNILCRKWLKGVIKARIDIQDWLNETIFNNKYFQFQGEL